MDQKSDEARPANSEASLSWLAGIIDGEGTICCSIQPDRLCRARVAVYNTNWKMIVRVKEILHGITGRAYPAFERTKLMPQSRKRQWQVQVQRNSEVLAVLETVLPYLVAKTTQATLAIQLCKSRRKCDREVAAKLAAGIKFANHNPPTPDEEAVETRLVQAAS